MFPNIVESGITFREPWFNINKLCPWKYLLLRTAYPPFKHLHLFRYLENQRTDSSRTRQRELEEYAED